MRPQQYCNWVSLMAREGREELKIIILGFSSEEQLILFEVEAATQSQNADGATLQTVVTELWASCFC